MNRIIHLLLAVGLACPVPLASVSANCGEATSVDGDGVNRSCCRENCQCGDSCQCGESEAPVPDESAPAPANTTSVELQRVLECSADVDVLDETSAPIDLTKKSDKPAMGSEKPEEETYTERLLKAKKKAWEDKKK